MAEIKTFSIELVEIDTVSYNYSYTPGSYTNRDGSGYNRITKEKTEKVSWFFSTTGGSSATSPCSYTRGGSGTTTYNLTATLTTEYTIKTYGWKYVTTHYNEESYIQLEDDEVELESIKMKYFFRGSSITNGKTIYYYDINEYSWSEMEPSTGTSTDTKTITFYPHPAKFTFTNCVQGGRWLVEEGIKKTLITNITDFQGQAQQRKNWKHQLEEGFSVYKACPSFFDDNVITRDQMNAVYRYVMEMKETEEKYKEFEADGKTPIYHKISAAMFNDLADRINEKTS